MALLGVALAGLAACTDAPASYAQPAPAPVTPPASILPASLTGPWEFGRARGIPGADAGPLCHFVLTETPARVGWQIGNGCNGNESYWALDGGKLLLLNGAFQVTSVLEQAAPNYWAGPYLGDTRVIHYLRR